MAHRSLLFSPADRPELMRKAPDSGADTVVFDLEDAVVGERKEEAREAVNGVLCEGSFDPDAEVCLRVDPRSVDDDIEVALSGDPRIDAVMLPKASSAADVEALVDSLANYGHELPVVVLCESAAGILHAESIAVADPVVAVAFGAEDLSADVGATRTDDGEEVSYARQHVVLAATAADVDAIDTVFTDIDDTDRLAAEAATARGLGYDGKMAIHPKQVSVINEAFTPDREEIEWAERVLAAKDDAEAAGRGVFRLDDEMIDAPMIARAEDVLDRARAADRD